MPSGNLITMPALPASPATIEPAWNDIVGATTNVYTGEQQFMNWGVGPCEISVTFAAMSVADGQAFVEFLQALQGQLNYFTFNSALNSAYSEILTAGSPPGPRYWRLKSNQRKWSVPKDRNYRISFDCREAL